MERGFLEKSIRSKASKRCIFLFVVLCIMLLIMIISWRYIYAMITGYTALTDAADAEVKFETGIHYVTLDSPAIYDIGYGVETTTKRRGRVVSQKMTSFYVLAETDSGLILVELPYKYYDDEDFSYENVSFKGRLFEPGRDAGVMVHTSELLAETYETTPEAVLDELLAVVYLDATYRDFSPQICGLIGIVALAGLIANIRIFFNYRLSGTYRELSKFGSPEAVEEVIDREFADSNQYLIMRSGTDYIFSSYIISNSGGLEIRPTADLVWVYRHSVKRKAVTTHYIKFFFKNRYKETEFSMVNEAAAVQFITELVPKLPVVYGYSEELKKLYNQNPEEFIEMCTTQPE